MHTTVPFSAIYEQWSLQGDHLCGANANNVLYLHGAGTSSRAGYRYPREQLQQRGIGTTCFDYVGHGQTGGVLENSSLASRARQLDTVIAARQLTAPLAVLGSSMGAYDAIRLTQRIAVTSLVLIVPGVYDPEAFEVPFGPQFSRIIRRTGSWKHSDAWSILEKFTGKLLVISAEHDAVIPREIPERLHDAAKNAHHREHLVIAGADHGHLFSVLREAPATLDHAMERIVYAIASA